MSLKLNASAVYCLQNWSPFHRNQAFFLCSKQSQPCYRCPKVSCAINMAAGQSSDPEKSIISNVMDRARIIWDSSPQPVKSFPWHKTLEKFSQLILDLFLMVVKYLSVPLFAITSISEMSYCAHERKLHLVPFPLLIGYFVAGVLKDAALESSPYLKNAEVPWHLISTLIFFALLKFPGPYYPYWGRVVIPHLANGVLQRTLWFMFLWYRKPRKSSEIKTSDFSSDSP